MKKTIDLWTPVVAIEKQHPNYQSILKVGSKGSQNVVTSWARGFSDRDGKLVTEFQTTFDSTFWELYLFACFKMLRLHPALHHHAPDFMIRMGVDEVAVEATIAKEAEGYRPEWDKLDAIRSPGLPGIFQRLRYTTTRLANRFVSKVDEYRKKYVQLTHVGGRPFLIAIAPFDQPFTFDLALQAMRRVLYRADTPIFHRDPKTGEAIVLGNAGIDSVTKDNGSEIPLGMFCDPSYSDVSAVLFSSTATWSKARALSRNRESMTTFYAERYNAYTSVPLTTVAKKPHYSETLLDGLLVCLNPFADRPIDPTVFINNAVAIESWNRRTESYVADIPHEWLIRRLCLTVKPVPSPAPSISSPKRNYKEITPPLWRSGRLRQVPVLMWPASKNWMAHYRGWTIVVLNDGIDKTWHAFAVEQIAHTIPEVREINLKGVVKSIWKMRDHSTQRAAFEAIKKSIRSQLKTRSRRSQRFK